jgi:hypothetical protein
MPVAPKSAEESMLVPVESVISKTKSIVEAEPNAVIKWFPVETTEIE